MSFALPGAAPTGMFGLAPHASASAMPIMHSSAGSLPLDLTASAAGTSTHGQWSPYEMNGGSSLAIAGDGWAVLAADTRLSEGYSILSRNVSKTRVLTDRCVIGTGGCFSDVYTLHKVLSMRVDSYRHDHDCDMSATAMAQMLGVELYYRRFFPYYAFNVVAGIDAAGKGAVFTYDAVGSFERVNYAAQGAGQKLMIPLLDELVGRKNRADATADSITLSAEDAINLVKEAFLTAGERDIYTGDDIEILVVTLEGVRKEIFHLKRD